MIACSGLAFSGLDMVDFAGLPLIIELVSENKHDGCGGGSKMKQNKTLTYPPHLNHLFIDGGTDVVFQFDYSFVADHFLAQQVMQTCSVVKDKKALLVISTLKCQT